MYQHADGQFHSTPEGYKPIDAVTVQTASLSMNNRQFSPVASPGYVVQADPLLPSYSALTTPATTTVSVPAALPTAAPAAPAPGTPGTPKRIARKPVGGLPIPAPSLAPVQPPLSVDIPPHSFPAQVPDIPSFDNVPIASPVTAVLPYSPGSPVDVASYYPSSPITQTPTYDSLNSISSVPSSPTSLQSPYFVPFSPTTTDTSIPETPASPTFSFPSIPAPPVGGYPRLTKPIVIPQVLNHTIHKDVIGKPFVRAYARCLDNFNLNQDAFLDFLDELNIDFIGHVGFEYTRKAGKAIHAAGSFDPTGITKLVGQGVSLTAQLGEIAYIKGPTSKKKWYIDGANREIFAPRGLKVSVVHSKELRRIMGVDAKFPLCAPLMTDWVVPTRDQLNKGQRAKCRVAGRIIYQLSQHVENIVLAREANDTLMVTGSLAQRKAARSVRNWQVGSEVQHEVWRGEALALYERAKTAVTEKQRQKLLKQAAQTDKEMINTEKISWLVIQNLDVGTNPLVTV